MSADAPTVDTPVLIVGGGAVGCLEALMLARHGVPSIVVERLTSPHTAPRAHALNPRSLEILRQFDFDAEELAAVSLDPAFGGQVRFVRTVLGHEYGAVPYERQDDAVEEVTPTRLLNIPQPDFETILFRMVSAEPLIDYRRGIEWLSSSDGDDAVESIVQTPRGPLAIRSQYVVAADGAGSAVRESRGIRMTGVNEVSSAVSITFRADLTGVLAERPAVLYWVTDPEVRGTLLAYRANSLWNYILFRPPGRIDMAHYGAEACESLIRAAIGLQDSTFGIEILDAIPWTMRAEVADRYRDGRVFLAGDSAHRFPPTGGLGLNSGLQDAHNLAFKLALVLRGDADDGLLDTYSAEREPIARQNAQQSLDNARRLDLLDELAWPIAEGSEDDFTAWLTMPGRHERIREIIAAQIPHFDSLALQLGFTYRPGERPPADVSRFEPGIAEGGRFPHAWLRRGSTRVSTLDLFAPDAFTLVALNRAQPGWPSPLVRAITVPESEFEDAEWAAHVGFPREGSVLVRPDGHVLAVFESMPGEAELALVISSYLAVSEDATL